MRIEDVDKIIELGLEKDYRPTKNDIAFNILKDIVGNETAGYLVYKAPVTQLAKYVNSNKNRFIRARLKEYGISIWGANTQRTDAKGFQDEKANVSMELTKEQNKADLIELLSRIKRLSENGDMDPKDAVRLETDIRVKLNDKFEMEKSEDERKIIVVPNKRDIVCPYTNRECYSMPSKEACMKYYNLTDADK